MNLARKQKLTILLITVLLLFTAAFSAYAEDGAAVQAVAVASVEEVKGIGDPVSLTVTVTNTADTDMTGSVMLLYKAADDPEPVTEFGENGVAALKAGEEISVTVEKTYEFPNKSAKGFTFLLRTLAEDGSQVGKDQKVTAKVKYAGTGIRGWLDKLNETFIYSGYYKMMLEGFGNTLLITALALVIGVAIGALIAIIKYFAEDISALKPLAWLCDLYTTVVRGIPMVVLLLIFYFIILASADGITVAFIAFGINSGAYMAELIRSGLNAVDKGQMEAGRSLGMSKMQAMRRIILPQALRYVLPAIGNELIALLKETSVAGYVAVVDLTRAGNLVRNNTYDAINPLMIVAVVYLAMVVLLTQLLGALERRLKKSDNR